MKIFTTRSEIQQHLTASGGKTIGFVPTMGALHQGHLSLIAQAKAGNDVVVCSIFVNPTQFTNARDLEDYPRPIDADIAKLEAAGCDILFNPPVTEMYDGNEHWHLNIGQLEFLLEGEFRPGHYQGVMQVVYKLLDIIKPTTLYLGQKDYQQFMVVSKMVEMLGISVQLVMCAIERETDGLAMSSRNIHLTPVDRQHALILSKTLNWLKNNFNIKNVFQLEQDAMAMLQSEPGVEPEYIEIADGKTLLPANEQSTSIVALAAARVGKTRLIDNVVIV
ncbi:pantoate--beta-alanine ligase [Mucilaginibacter psychrotolerans]|uniref:Pantothenate synthetase n=1 Tax=Mucilaginibacter psychrotolerans TaxID=1524096 RepID=A0A4Y8SB05_9SPHI|nr:pantoate--beta-alanine ligase [Mucilaginibacter psychrotolerans]TFF36158.1 pantoate--beta-alanine ligase [Mucilaginibacter psychrotolerans]